ncbi:excalibur calcium-binding domain-containing protein [Streptomyces sp. M2CJ-2]|uniref:excalibur calcium-binding domain-containing protein n=1 Tax=Streptomyces sp. M2CJ-2 TaxID=2803948 RepID=UPI001925F2F7|nr:excalibur calcium-binding domain-containing protein [Streptomyces sp. M2CJ-2]MBL3670211.1 excalibur calcium-binding domain-containing protein [Streptomyces sp. M2CJ-2]
MAGSFPVNLSCKSAAVTVAALALATLPVTTAAAHEGSHPFKNCTEAYDAGYSDIEVGDEHYGKHLDRDGDGVGCDKAPAGFVPADDKGGGSHDDGTTGSDAGDKGTTEKGGGTDLAETGGNSATPYLAAGGAAVVLAGGAVLLASRRRRSTN